MSMMEHQPTSEEIEEAVANGGPWITLTFTSEDQAFEQKRILTLAQAEDVRDQLSAEIESAKSKYNISEGNDE